MAQSQGTSPPTKVPQGVEAATQLITGRETKDIIAFVILPMGLATLLYLPGILTMKGMGGTFAGILVINYILFSIIPENESIVYWGKSWWDYKRNPKVLLKDGISVREIDEDVKMERGETGGRDMSEMDTSKVISTEESTEDTTRIDAIDTERNVIKLSDGSVVAALRVRGMERTLINEAIKSKVDERFANVLQSFDYELSINITSVEFVIEDVISEFDDRLDDKDISDKPILKRNIKSKKNYIETRIKGLGMNSREYYVIVNVSPSEQSIDDGGPFNLDFIDPNSPIGKRLRNRKAKDEASDMQQELVDSVQSRVKSTKRSMEQIRQVGIEETTGEGLARINRSLYHGTKGNINGWEPSSEVVVSESQEGIN